MTCTKRTETCEPVPSALKLAGLGHNGRCLIPIQPPPGGYELITNPDGTGFCWVKHHTPAHLTNTKAPFEWSDANQCGNIPIVTITKNPDGSYTIDPGDGGTPITITAHKPLTLTRNQDLTNSDPRASLDVANQILNLPPALLAHVVFNGTLAVAQNAWSNVRFGSLYQDTSGNAMYDPGTGNIRIMRTGYYQLDADATFTPPTECLAAHGLAITQNGTILQRSSTMPLASDPLQTQLTLRRFLHVGDIIGAQALSSQFGGNTLINAHLSAQWICD